jgi:hypothetical protein
MLAEARETAFAMRQSTTAQPQIGSDALRTGASPSQLCMNERPQLFLSGMLSHKDAVLNCIVKPPTTYYSATFDYLSGEQCV